MIKRGLALIVAVFAMVQLAGGTLPAEAEEPVAIYETMAAWRSLWRRTHGAR